MSPNLKYFFLFFVDVGRGARLNEYFTKNPNLKKKTRNVTVCNKCPRRSLIMTLIPGCDLEHSLGTLTLGVGT